MSHVPGHDLPLGERIKALRLSLPRPEDRQTKSDLPYPTQDEFAKMLGTDRFRVIDWEKNSGVRPEARFRRKMAELSEGRYTSDYFGQPLLADREQLLRIAVLLDEAAGLLRELLDDESVPEAGSPTS